MKMSHLAGGLSELRDPLALVLAVCGGGEAPRPWTAIPSSQRRAEQRARLLAIIPRRRVYTSASAPSTPHFRHAFHIREEENYVGHMLPLSSHFFYLNARIVACVAENVKHSPLPSLLCQLEEEVGGGAVRANTRAQPQLRAHSWKVQETHFHPWTARRLPGKKKQKRERKRKSGPIFYWTKNKTAASLFSPPRDI